MSSINLLYDMVQEFKQRSSGLVPPDHVIIHPITELELSKNMVVGPPKIHVDEEDQRLVMTITVMDVKMKIYRSYDVTPGKFILG